MIIKIIRKPRIPAFGRVEKIDQIVGLVMQASHATWLSPLDLTSDLASSEDTAKIYVRRDNLLNAAEEMSGEKPGLYNELRRILGRFQKDECIVLHSSEVKIIE